MLSAVGLQQTSLQIYDVWRAGIGILRQTADFAGLPGISIPCGQDSDLQMPVGLQLIAPAFGELELLKVAHIYEQSTVSHL